ncbi:MAG: nitrate reductase [Alphaproteobacteria bacterium]|nr:nitrate reductase [Alphaproteobacteria bacterium]
MQRSRRQFIRGRWLGRVTLDSPAGASEIASILIQAQPSRLVELEAAIAEIPGAEIYQRDVRGKLVVVVEGGGEDPVGAALTRLSLLPDVISATLVYHTVETDHGYGKEGAS